MLMWDSHQGSIYLYCPLFIEFLYLLLEKDYTKTPKEEILDEMCEYIKKEL